MYPIKMTLKKDILLFYFTLSYKSNNKVFIGHGVSKMMMMMIFCSKNKN